MYAGLNVAIFFVILFVQQVGGYKPIVAGLALLPVTLLMFLLSRRFAALADRIGPHYFMGFGPIIAGLGLLLLVRTDARAHYVSAILPGILVFGIGLSATVAPLTATVLGSVQAGHSGVASGVNNAIARVAGLLAIAALGAIVASSFSSRLDHNLAGHRLSPRAAAVVASDRTRALVVSVNRVPVSERSQVHAALVNASVYAFRIGLGIGAGLVVLGGIVALIGIENPRRTVPCAECPGGALQGATVDVARRAPDRGPVAAESPA